MSENSNATEAKNLLGEAGGIAFTTISKTKKLEDGSVEKLEINLTSRGVDAASALDGLFAGLEHAYELGYTAWRRISEKTTPLPTSSDAPAGGMSKLPGNAEQPAQPPAQEQPSNGSFHAVKMVVTPRADGKVDLEFFAENHQYHDLKATKTVDAAITVLSSVAPFTPADLAKTGTYPVNVNVRWVNSENRNRNGIPYKNLVDILPA